MTTARTARKAAAAVEVPAPESAPAAEIPAATETPGAAEPDAAAPGSGQEGAPEGERPEPALDEAQDPDGDGGQDDGSDDPAPAEPYDFAAHWRRVTSGPWPMPDPPVIFTPEARAVLREHDRATAQLEREAHAAHAALHQNVMAEENQRLDDWMAMRAVRFPRHAVAAAAS